MLTLFTTTKPFKGHTAIIQRNALQSWKLLHPDVEITVFGDDEGSAEICAELRLRHESHVERNEFGTPLVNAMFAKAQAVARHDLLCCANCDIIFMADFRRAIERVRSKHAQFLMVGRRWDMDVTQPIDFSSPSWGNRIHEEAIRANHQRDGFWIDYFVFSRGLYSADVPAFAIGRTAWDNWLVWKACVSGHPVVDVSQDVIAIHQNHDYNHHPQGSEGIWRGQEAKRNLVLAGGPDHWGGMDDATLVLKSGRLGRNYRRHRRQFEKRWQPIWSGIQEFTVYKLWLPAWHRFLDATRPARTVLGLRSKAMRARQSHQ